MSLSDSLRGTGVALVTPFKENYDLDADSLKNVIQHVINGGVQYVVTLGTTGEPPTLSKENKIAVIETTLDAVAGRVPVVMGVSGNNTSEVVKELEKLPLSKATALLHASPYYNRPSQEGIFQHYKAVAESSPVPVIIYNVPSRTGSNLTAETTLRLATECKNIGGIKEASGNFGQCMHILKSRPKEFLVVSGDDLLSLPLIACGMDGVISVAANAFPQKFSGLVSAALDHDFDVARNLQYELLDAFDLMFAENNPAGVKCFLSEMKLIKNVVRLPLVPLSKKYADKVKEYLSAHSS